MPPYFHYPKNVLPFYKSGGQLFDMVKLTKKKKEVKEELKDREAFRHFRFSFAKPKRTLSKRDKSTESVSQDSADSEVEYHAITTNEKQFLTGPSTYDSSEDESTVGGALSTDVVSTDRPDEQPAPKQALETEESCDEDVSQRTRSPQIPFTVFEEAPRIPSPCFEGSATGSFLRDMLEHIQGDKSKSGLDPNEQSMVTNDEERFQKPVCAAGRATGIPRPISSYAMARPRTMSLRKQDPVMSKSLEIERDDLLTSRIGAVDQHYPEATYAFRSLLSSLDAVREDSTMSADKLEAFANTDRTRSPLSQLNDPFAYTSLPTSARLTRCCGKTPRCASSNKEDFFSHALQDENWEAPASGIFEEEPDGLTDAKEQTRKVSMKITGSGYGAATPEKALGEMNSQECHSNCARYDPEDNTLHQSDSRIDLLGKNANNESKNAEQVGVWTTDKPYNTPDDESGRSFVTARQSLSRSCSPEYLQKPFPRPAISGPTRSASVNVKQRTRSKSIGSEESISKETPIAAKFMKLGRHHTVASLCAVKKNPPASVTTSLEGSRRTPLHLMAGTQASMSRSLSGASQFRRASNNGPEGRPDEVMAQCKGDEGMVLPSENDSQRPLPVNHELASTNTTHLPPSCNSREAVHNAKPESFLGGRVREDVPNILDESRKGGATYHIHSPPLRNSPSHSPSNENISKENTYNPPPHNHLHTTILPTATTPRPPLHPISPNPHSRTPRLNRKLELARRDRAHRLQTIESLGLPPGMPVDPRATVPFLLKNHPAFQRGNMEPPFSVASLASSRASSWCAESGGSWSGSRVVSGTGLAGMGSMGGADGLDEGVETRDRGGLDGGEVRSRREDVVRVGGASEGVEDWGLDEAGTEGLFMKSRRNDGTVAKLAVEAGGKGSVKMTDSAKDSVDKTVPRKKSVWGKLMRRKGRRGNCG